MTLDSAVLGLDALAELLARAESAREPIGPISELRPGMSIDDAYAVQSAGRRLREAAGDRVVGHKIGLTSKAMQEAIGVNQPDYGYVLASQVFESGSHVQARRFISPRVEGEIAFRLASPLAGASVTAEEVLAATDSVAPALELIDSRIRDWKVTIVDTISDNAAAGGAVFGAWVAVSDLGMGLDEIPLSMTVDGEVVEGRGDAALGHPAESVAWLARALHAQGEVLAAGEVILSGGLAPALPVVSGTRAVATLGPLGGVGVTF
jgi:2-keto-4-pentenoate hydratase